jgi:hypothetical protein
LLSNKVTQVLGKSIVDLIYELLKSTIESESPHAYMCYRHDLRHFDEYTNSSCEGNFNAIKHSSASMKPNLSLLRATETLSFNADYKCALYNQAKGKASQSTYTWPTALSVSHDLVPYAAKLLEDQNTKSKQYECFHHDTLKWVVRSVLDDDHVQEEVDPEIAFETTDLATITRFKLIPKFR